MGKAEHFGCHVLAYDIAPDPELRAHERIQYVSLENIYEKSDVISLHVPLTPETRHLVDASAIEKMKPGVVLINTGRGALIDTKALVSALKTGKIGAAVLFDIERLARTNPSDGERTKLPATNTLDIHDFNEQEKTKLAAKIMPNHWIELLLSPLESQPIFRYRSREQEYIDFNDASAGQQATALMHVLLNQDGPPLIIDQPEDDLDSNIIDQVCTEIWSAKTKRQLLFSSHNANLVVNGDAELVVSCDYRIAGDQSGGKIANLGAIDVEDVRKAITKIMEGGEKAFGLRRQKYGF